MTRAVSVNCARLLFGAALTSRILQHPLGWPRPATEQAGSIARPARLARTFDELANNGHQLRLGQAAPFHRAYAARAHHCCVGRCPPHAVFLDDYCRFCQTNDDLARRPAGENHHAVALFLREWSRAVGRDERQKLLVMLGRDHGPRAASRRGMPAFYLDAVIAW